MRIIKYIILIYVFSLSNSYSFEFKKGEGSEFVFSTEGKNVNLNIYIANITSDEMAVEFHFGSSDIISMNMWQQFIFGLKDQSPIVLKAGYIKTGENNNVEKMTNEMIRVNKGVQIEDFLFTDKKVIDKDFIADEKIETPAGVIIAKHYKKVTMDQTVDFWIADMVKPIGLVKLVSKSEKTKTNNYEIELKSLLKNVDATINPKDSKPISESTKKLLNK